MATDIATDILKNVDNGNAGTGSQVAALIAGEAEKRPHLKGSVVDVNWNRKDGIGVEVDNTGHMQHLANAIGLDIGVKEFRITSPARAVGYKRTGTFAGYQVTVWCREY